MKAEDFTLSANEASRLASVDECMEAGLPRQLSEKLVGHFEEWLNVDFAACLSSVDAKVADESDRAFVKAAIVGFLSDFVENKMPLAAITQTIYIATHKEV